MKPKKILVLLLLLVLLFPVVLGSLTLPGLGSGITLLFHISRLCALLGFVFFGAQIILGMKLKFIETYFGHDKMIVLHRKFGLVALVLVSFHGVVSLWVAEGRDKVGLLLGMVALFLLLLMSLFILIRKVFNTKYEYWHIVHQLNYLIFGLAFIHSLWLGSSIRNSLVWRSFWSFLGLVFLASLIYKIRSGFRMRKYEFQVAEVVQETPTIWTIRFVPRKLDFKPGQFAILRLIQAGIPDEPHPFTIASSPTDGALAFSIREVGDFTRKIKEVKGGVTALIDAPYGKFSFLEFPAEEYLFIAGGIGITPFMSMLRYMRDTGMSKKVVLLWGNRFEREIAFQAELNAIEGAIAGLRVANVISDEPNWQGEKGFINAALIQKYGGDLTRTEIFICGPPVMLDLVLKELQKLNIPKERIHFERFSL